MQSCFLDSIAKRDVPYTPLWLMRQAGRYLPEYREVRAKAGSFLKLCKNPELAVEVTLQPLRRFNLDAAIMFSDILVIPEAMGLNLSFVENEGPRFSTKISCAEDIDRLSDSEILMRLEYVFATIRGCKNELKPDTALIGFSGSPFTLACYMLEGGSSSDYAQTKKFLYNTPELMHKLLDKLTSVIIQYLSAQIAAGVDSVMLFDSWGGMLSDAAYSEFSLAYMQKIIAGIPVYNQSGIKVPRIVFTKGGGSWLRRIAAINPDVIGLDWTVNIGDARAAVQTSLQGNLDPLVLAYADKNAIRKEVIRILDAYKAANQGNISGHVFNLGHGILQATPPDNVAYLADLVHELSGN